MIRKVKVKKEYIKDNNKIRRCPANISKMNIFEWVYYDFKDWNELSNMKYHLRTSLKDVCLGTLNLICILLLPISILIAATFSIHHAKKEVKRYENSKNVV